MAFDMTMGTNENILISASVPAVSSSVLITLVFLLHMHICSFFKAGTFTYFTIGLSFIPDKHSSVSLNGEAIFNYCNIYLHL